MLGRSVGKSGGRAWKTGLRIKEIGLTDAFRLQDPPNL
jgi:hypothetical protein